MIDYVELITYIIKKYTTKVLATEKVGYSTKQLFHLRRSILQMQT